MREMFNTILDSPPDSFGGVSVNADYKSVLKFFRVMGDENLNDEDKALLVMRIFFCTLPKFDLDRVWEFIEWFILRGEDSEPGGQHVFDWCIDAGRIYAAFYQTYNIDLRYSNLHWWVFKDLFDALPSDTKLNEVIKIRSLKPGKNDSREYKAQLQKLKQAYAIDKKQQSIFDAL